ADRNSCPRNESLSSHHQTKRAPLQASSRRHRSCSGLSRCSVRYQRKEKKNNYEVSHFEVCFGNTYAKRNVIVFAQLPVLIVRGCIGSTHGKTQNLKDFLTCPGRFRGRAARGYFHSPCIVNAAQ